MRFRSQFCLIFFLFLNLSLGHEGTELKPKATLPGQEPLKIRGYFIERVELRHTLWRGSSHVIKFVVMKLHGICFGAGFLLKLYYTLYYAMHYTFTKFIIWISITRENLYLLHGGFHGIVLFPFFLSRWRIRNSSGKRQMT